MKPSSRAQRNAGRLVLLAALTGTAISVATLTVEGRALACGGCFCNAPPPNPFQPLPIAQDGENVVFAITKDPAGGAPTITAHIQILYTGDATKFSWIVPVEAVPKLSTGSDKLFSALASVTQPTFVANYETSGSCLPNTYGNSPPYAPNGATGAAGAGAASADGGVTGVQVAFQGAVGPFDTAVISSTDPAALKQWLTDNGYTVTDAAGAIIDQYVREHKYFVALKLLNGLGVRSIQPIVLTFQGTEACVPLRLTAIAANPDMPVLVWVLGDKRVVPRGFYEMTIDEARINWWAGGGNYFGAKGLVSQAADEAGGNAFITEYAGPSTIASQQVYVNGQIDLATLKAAATPPAYLAALAQMGLANDPLMLGLLSKYIPMPSAVKAMGISDAQFYGNVSFYWNMYAFPSFDLAGLTDAISTSIVMPRAAAQMMIDAHPYLTRLNTYLSPAEMNQDAFFLESANLPDVSNVHTATIRTMCGQMDYMACNAPTRLELADGRGIWISAGRRSSTCDYGTNGYDVSGLASLPASRAAYQRDGRGEGTVVVDNTKKIQVGIDANNARMVTQMLFPTTGAGGATGAAGAGGTAGAGGFTGAAGSSVGGSGKPPFVDSPRATGGSGCDVGGGGGNLAALAVACAVGRALLSRRRRRDCSEG